MTLNATEKQWRIGCQSKKALNTTKGNLALGYVIKEQFPLALIEVAKVSTFGIDKYGEGNWQHVAAKRYVDAAMRHAVAKGTDDDTGSFTPSA